MDEDTFTLERVKEKGEVGTYTVTISPHVHKRLDKHIFVIKKLIDKGLKKNNWLLSALIEKLEREAPYQEVSPAKTITIKMEPKLEQLILQRVNHIKKLRKSYSKKQWILDAIIDKLDRDEENIDNKLLEIRPKHGLTDQQQADFLMEELKSIKSRIQKK